MKEDSILKIKNVVSGYDTSNVINDISFDIKESSILAISGRNGVGKSTLLKTIIGIVECKSGEIYFLEKNITKSRPTERSILGIGYVPQGRDIAEFDPFQTAGFGAAAGELGYTFDPTTGGVTKTGLAAFEPYLGSGLAGSGGSNLTWPY